MDLRREKFEFREFWGFFGLERRRFEERRLHRVTRRRHRETRSLQDGGVLLFFLWFIKRNLTPKWIRGRLLIPLLSFDKLRMTGEGNWRLLGIEEGNSPPPFLGKRGGRRFLWDSCGAFWFGLFFFYKQIAPDGAERCLVIILLSFIKRNLTSKMNSERAVIA